MYHVYEMMGNGTYYFHFYEACVCVCVIKNLVCMMWSPFWGNNMSSISVAFLYD